MARSLFDALHFGKHKDDLLIDVIKNDTEYANWLVQEKIITLDNEAYAEYKKCCEGKWIEP